MPCLWAAPANSVVDGVCSCVSHKKAALTTTGTNVFPTFCRSLSYSVLVEKFGNRIRCCVCGVMFAHVMHKYFCLSLESFHIIVDCVLTCSRVFVPLFVSAMPPCRRKSNCSLSKIRAKDDVTLCFAHACGRICMKSLQKSMNT